MVSRWIEILRPTERWRLGQQNQALANNAGAATQAAAVLAPDPAILAGPHQAKTRTRCVAKFGLTQLSAVGQKGHQQRVTLQRADLTTIHAQAHGTSLGFSQTN